MDKFKFDAGFKALCLAVGHKFDSEIERVETLRVYYQTLSKNGFNDQVWEKTINKMILNWKPSYNDRFPTVRDFLDVNGMSASAIAEKAHKGIKDRITSVGSSCSHSLGIGHKFDVAHEVIREMGGWVLISQNPSEWDRRKPLFVKTFERLYYEDVPKNKPLLGSSIEDSQRFLAKYNNNQIENIK